MSEKKRLFWIDLEMTGLDEKVHVILEVAAVVTDLDFNPLEEFHRIVHQPQEELDKMDDWCRKTHGKSGLTEQVKTGTSVAEVEHEILDLIGRHFKPASKPEDRIVLCGNSIGNDRRFIDKYLPRVAKRLHYRMIDVSSFKEIFREKYGIKVKKKDAHRALDDIQESIGELKTYLSYVTVANTNKPTK